MSIAATRGASGGDGGSSRGVADSALSWVTGLSYSWGLGVRGGDDGVGGGGGGSGGDDSGGGGDDSGGGGGCDGGGDSSGGGSGAGGDVASVRIVGDGGVGAASEDDDRVQAATQKRAVKEI